MPQEYGRPLLVLKCKNPACRLTFTQEHPRQFYCRIGCRYTAMLDRANKRYQEDEAYRQKVKAKNLAYSHWKPSWNRPRKAGNEA